MSPDPDAPLTVEPATERDVPLILRFIRELAEYQNYGHAVSATEAALRETLFGARPAAEVVLARAGGEPAGFALYFQNYSTWLARPGLYLEDLYVSPGMRGRGVGKALLVHLARIARQRGYARFEWSVLDWNEPAIRFYKGLGAVPLAEGTVYRLTGEPLARLAAGDG
jgi:GNAT superfamily N-acetyltransferase